ncbi:MAG TPA: AraC family transcriptional regulator [Ohtaekwangia sp.]|uniref:helix-turn-helix domain-containing protein n=1 Tax=Ohtaekwangia sp. TaxID=2066019 RepID=UPI002F94D58E
MSSAFRLQSIDEFYQSRVDLTEAKRGYQFSVLRIEDRLKAGGVYPNYIRRDFYKILFFRGPGVFHYGDQSIRIEGDTLLFFNPRVPYTYDPVSQAIGGYFCIFQDEFFQQNLRLKLDEIPLFMPGTRPVFSLNKEQATEVAGIFERMIGEMNSDYTYKYDLIRSYVSQLIYYAMKLEPLVYTAHQTNAATRITAIFMELLDRQFPVDLSPDHKLLRSPKDFADHLSIHVNYLNRAVKKETGKTTTEHIFERLIGEAKAMLKHTDLNIAEISYTLGFEDQAHFNNFFKKRVKISPTAFRSV